MREACATSLSKRGAAAFAAALTFTGAPSLALAQPRQSSHAPAAAQGGLFQDQSEASAKRYATPDGTVRFVFDRTLGRIALVRFEGDPEVHVLQPVAAAGGGEIYRTDDSNVILRVTPHGGIIVYTRLHRTGAPASEVANAAPLEPEAVAQAYMRERLRELQAEAARKVGQQVTFDTPVQVNSAASGIVLDAAERAAQGLADAPMTTVRHVVITIGTQPGVVMREETLTIQVAPQMGFAGRPSSATIRNVVTGQVQGPQQ
jgi:hypothetical protein